MTALQARPTHYRATVYPTAGVDAEGHLYVAWADGRNVGHGNDILFEPSVDQRQHLEQPRRSNSDAGSADQLMPALAVARWRRDGVPGSITATTANNYNYDVYMARSTRR